MQETKTPTGRRGRRKSKPENDSEGRVATAWLGEDEKIDAAKRSSSTESGHSDDDSEAEADETMTGGLFSPTNTAAARKMKAKAASDLTNGGRARPTATRIVCGPNGI